MSWEWVAIRQQTAAAYSKAETEENHQKPHLREPVIGPKFEPRPFQL